MSHNWTSHQRGHLGADPPARPYSEPIGYIAMTASYPALMFMRGSSA
jgi:hypothetical protein